MRETENYKHRKKTGKVETTNWVLELNSGRPDGTGPSGVTPWKHVDFENEDKTAHVVHEKTQHKAEHEDPGCSRKDSVEKREKDRKSNREARHRKKKKGGSSGKGEGRRGAKAVGTRRKKQGWRNEKDGEKKEGN